MTQAELDAIDARLWRDFQGLVAALRDGSAERRWGHIKAHHIEALRRPFLIVDYGSPKL